MEDAGYLIKHSPMSGTGHSKRKNWVQTIPGQGWWIYLRFYVPIRAYFDKSWAMPDFKKIS
jgi:hypothetical protein